MDLASALVLIFVLLTCASMVKSQEEGDRCDPNVGNSCGNGNLVCRPVNRCTQPPCSYKCQQPLEIGAPCMKTKYCKAKNLPKGYFCDRVVCGCFKNKCSCGDGYFDDKGACRAGTASGYRPEIGSPCNFELCAGENTVCGPISKECECAVGFYEFKGECYPLKSIGDRCKKSTHCRSNNLAPGEVCMRENGCGCYKKRCSCAPGYKEKKNGSCKLIDLEDVDEENQDEVEQAGQEGSENQGESGADV